MLTIRNVIKLLSGEVHGDKQQRTVRVAMRPKGECSREKERFSFEAAC